MFAANPWHAPTQGIRRRSASGLLRFDHGADCSGGHPCNLEVYGQAQPPAYNLTAITTPLAIFTGGPALSGGGYHSWPAACPVGSVRIRLRESGTAAATAPLTTASPPFALPHARPQATATRCRRPLTWRSSRPPSRQACCATTMLSRTTPTLILRWAPTPPKGSTPRYSPSRARPQPWQLTSQLRPRRSAASRCRLVPAAGCDDARQQPRRALRAACRH